MAKISTYPILSTPTLNDLLIGTDVEDFNKTKNFLISDIADFILADNYVPYLGADKNLNLGIHSVIANSFIVNSGTATQFLKADGTLDSTVYQPAGNYITQLSGEASASGPGNAAVTLNNAAVIGKVLTGLSITGSVITSSDSILTAFGKVQNQINTLVGGVQYQGTWNAATNTPTLVSSVGVQGYYFVVSVAGSTNLNGITDWKLGDWAIFNGSTWDKVDNTDAVISVNGQIGAVVLTTTNIAEGTNLYYTDVRVRNALSLTVTGNNGASTYNAATGVFNVPEYTLAGLAGVPLTRQITINGVAQDLSADRSYSVGTVTSVATTAPLTGGTITGAGTLGITQAGAATDGYLSSTDWNTFNNKQNTIVNPVTGTGTALTLPMWGSASSLVNSPLSFLSDTFTFQYNSPTGATVVFSNNALTAYTYSIQMNNFGSPRSTIHSYTDGIIVQSIAGVQVSRVFANGNTVFGVGVADSGHKLELDGSLFVNTIANATIDTDRFLVSDSGVIKYRTGTELLSDIGGVPSLRTLTINGVTQDLSADRTFTIATHDAVTIGTANGLSLIGQQLSLGLASGSANGALSSVDYSTFNAKQDAGNYITSLTGEVTASGPGAAAATLLNSAVIGKVLTGLNLTGGGTITATDSILQAFGKTQNQISALVGGVIYEGVWNASTNTPTITSSVGTKGEYYVVNVAGSTNIDGITDWEVGDWIIFNGTTWDKVDNTDAVSSVNGFTGAVNLTTANIAEVTNLYYTDARARASISLTTSGSSGASTYNSSTGVLNIPNYATDTSGFVPYTGATSDLVLGNFELSAKNIISEGSAGLGGVISIKQDAAYLPKGNGYSSIASSFVTFDFFGYTGASTYKNFCFRFDGLTNNTLRTYTLQDADGTLAFTSDLTGFVTLGTAQTITGQKTISTNSNDPSLIINHTSGSGIGLSITKGGNGEGLVVNKTSGTGNAVTITGESVFFGRISTASGANTISLNANLGGVVNRIETTGALPLALVTNGSSITLAAGGVTPQFTLASTGAATFSSSVTSSLGSVGANFNSNAATTGSVNAYRVSNTTGVASYGIDSSAGGELITGGLAYATIVQSISNTPLQLGTNQTARLTILANGNVGIGTATPDSLLHVNNTINTAYDSTNTLISGQTMRVSNLSTTSGISANLLFIAQGAGGGNGLGSISGVNTGTGSLALTFGTRDSGGSVTERMRITSVGNVGIGREPAAGRRLDVNGVIRANVYDVNFNGVPSGFILSEGQWTGGSSTNLALAAEGAGNAITFFSGGSANERMRITSGGNVGIGTATPASILEAARAVANNQIILTESSDSGDDTALFYARRSRGTSLSSPTAIQALNNIGGLALGAYNGSAYAIGAKIKANSNQNWTTSAQGTNVIFETTADNTTTLTERMRITSAGYVYFNNGFGAANHRINLAVNQGNVVLVISAFSGISPGSDNDTAIFYGVGGASPNGAATALRVMTNSATGRSINAGGTINASGADYAEYMTKAVEDNIAKGDIVGIDSNAKVTNIFANAISFAVKSTDPSYVGGDVWGDIVGKRPTRTTDQTEEEFAPILVKFETELEEARAKVDRISFSGQVPCNVMGANVGDYIIPIKDKEGKISGQAIIKPTLEQYQISVGKVWKIMEDGRAWIAVKIG